MLHKNHGEPGTLRNTFYPALFQKLIRNKLESWQEYELCTFIGWARCNDKDDQ